MWRVTWRGVRDHPVRFLLSILAVVLGIAFVFGTFSLRASLSSTFDSIVDGTTTADVYVSADTDQASDITGVTGSMQATVPISLVDTLKKVDGVKTVEPDISGFITLVGADGTAVGGVGPPSYAFGVHENTAALKLTDGRWPAKSGQMVVEARTLDRAGLKLGGTTKVILNGRITEQKIVGVVDFDGATAGATIIGLDMDTATKAFAPDGRVPSIAVDATSGTDPATLAKSVSKALPADAHAKVVTGDSERAASKKAISDTLGFVSNFLLIFALIALFVGVFIILNTFAMVVRQRMQEIAVLRAMGASPKQVFGSVVGQAALVGVVGSVLGVFAGFGLVSVLRELIQAYGVDLTAGTPISVTDLVESLVLGTGVAVIAAGLPALQASRIPPIEAMRVQVATDDGKLTVRGWFGGVLLAIGGLGIVMALQGGAHDEQWFAVAAGGLLIGALVFSPVIARPVLGAIGTLFLPIKPLGRLARGNVVRNRRRTANTAGALMVGMALVGAVTVIAASAQASIGGSIKQDLKADYVVQGTQGSIPVGAAEAVEAIPDAGRVDDVYNARLGYGKKTIGVFAGSPGTFTQSYRLELVSGDPNATAKGEAALMKDFATKNHLAVGDTIELTQPAIPGSTPVSIEVGAIVDSQALSGAMSLPMATYDKLVPESLRTVTVQFVTAKPGKMDQVRTEITKAVKPYYVVSVQDAKEFVNSINATVNQVLAVLYALLGLSIVIAILGIVNTLALSIMERTREIGLMRAVGLGRLQLSGAIVIESVLIAVFGAIAGLAIGVGAGAVLPTVYADEGFTTLSVPWSQLVVLVVLAAIVGVIAAVWPAIRAARLPVLQAIAEE